MPPSEPIGICLTHPAGTRVFLLLPNAPAEALARVSVTLDGVTLNAHTSVTEPLVAWRGVPFPQSLADRLRWHASLVGALCADADDRAALWAELRATRAAIEATGDGEAITQVRVLEALLPPQAPS